MKHLAAFENALEEIRSEGRYRVFADLERRRGAYPRATCHGVDGRDEQVRVSASRLADRPR